MEKHNYYMSFAYHNNQKNEYITASCHIACPKKLITDKQILKLVDKIHLSLENNDHIDKKAIVILSLNYLGIERIE